MSDFLDGLNHPLLFLLFVTFGVLGLSAVLTFVFKAIGWSGPAALVQHP